MKKLLFLLPLLALFVACQQEDPVIESGRISFTNQVEDLTRGDNTLTTNNLVNFDVWGHNDNGVVFDGTRVEKQGDLWVSAVEKMWEHQQIYHFHAFAPAGAVENIGEYPNSERAKGLSNFAYTNDGSKDLIYAYATRTQGSPRRINDDPVQLPFEHLLSRVQFTFKNNLSEGNITITDVQITEAAKSAELNCADADMANWAWKATATGAYNFGNTSTIAQGASGATENVQFLFPAATRNYDISFSIAYESDAAEARTATISDVNFVMGKSYNINLVVNDKDVVTEEHKIEFFVTEVKDWGENIEIDGTILDSENNEGGNGGTEGEGNEGEENGGENGEGGDNVGEDDNDNQGGSTLQVVSGYENGYAYVDLGLSVKWATCNVGATTPEEYGDYFAWGEVEPKEFYVWTTYKHGKGYFAMIKYCTDSEYGKDGFNDKKTKLDPEDDAATANWGGAWRMPTDAEQDKLRNNCTWTWTTQNGVNGYKVTGPNGNSIFLPAAGQVGGETVGKAGYGYYWSSSLASADSQYALGMEFLQGRVKSSAIYRFEGQSVRPVCP